MSFKKPLDYLNRNQLIKSTNTKLCLQLEEEKTFEGGYKTTTRKPIKNILWAHNNRKSLMKDVRFFKVLKRLNLGAYVLMGLTCLYGDFTHRRNQRLEQADLHKRIFESTSGY